MEPLEEREGWEKIGEISVDAGLCQVGDPCFFSSLSEGNPFEDWGEFCRWLVAQERESRDWRFSKIPFKNGSEGRSVVVSSGEGDGSYPVYIRTTPYGRVCELRVVFIADGGEEEE